MNNFIFYSPTEFVFGKGVEERSAEMIQKYGGKKVMIVYGGGSVVRSGLLDKVKHQLDAANISHVELGGIQPNPTDDKVYEGIELGRKENIDFLFPIGGGSVIDTAKAIAVGIPYEGDFWDFFAGKATPASGIRIGTILTIPAAGSEGSGNAVITKVSLGKKLGIKTPEILRPAFAIMNPELTFTLPQWQTACGITDMMAHIMERYFSNTENTQVPDRMCEGTLKSIMEVALHLMDEPNDYDARANIMWAGTIAHNGTCGVGCVEDWSSHQLEHEMSALYNVSHGAGLAVVFPAWMTYMAEHNPHKIAQFANRVFDVPQTDNLKEMALQGIALLKDFYHKIGMPTTFKEIGIENPDIDLLVDNLHANKGEQFGNYMPLDRTATRTIYTLAN